MVQVHLNSVVQVHQGGKVEEWVVCGLVGNEWVVLDY